MVPMIFENHLQPVEPDLVKSMLGENHLPLEEQYNVQLSDQMGLLNIPQAHNVWEISRLVAQNNATAQKNWGLDTLNISFR